ncbi:MAG TPA: dynamin family protein [Candidatus Nanoarchaeia archaeon]|nr:dynamin family protein [Candidatus Nanoarchaeia archaeon]
MATAACCAIGINVESFHQSRDRLVSIFRRIESVASELQATEFVDAVQLTIADLAEDNFRLVVVGDFSRGKSTIINALLGEAVLPSAVRPITAVLTRIKRTKEPQYRLRFHSGETQDVTREELKELVAPKDPDTRDKAACENYQQQISFLSSIALAEVGSTAAFLAEGVEIVDTPGTNDLDVMREKITYDFIPRADSVVVVLSARMPLSRSELDFIRERILKADISRIFFAINHADHLTPTERPQVVEFVRQHLESVVPNPRIYLVCGKAALAHRIVAAGGSAKGTDLMPFSATGFSELESELSSFLVRERAETKLARPRSRAFRICSELTRGPLALAASLVGRNLNELEARLHELEPKIAEIEQERDRVLAALRTAMTNHQFEISQSLRSEMESVAEAAVTATSNYTGPLTKEDISQHLEHVVAPLQAQMQERIRAMQERAIQEECGRAQRRLDFARNELFDGIKKLLGSPRQDVGDVETIHADLQLGAFVKAGVGGLGIGALAIGIHLFFPLALLAGVLGGGIILAFFADRARAEVLGKVRIQVDRRFRDVIGPVVTDFNDRWRQHTDKLCSVIKAEFDRNLQSVRSQFEQVFHEHAQASMDAEQRRQNLDRLRAELESCERELKSVFTVERNV